MQNTRVTVVIPAYKNKAHTEACVQSVLDADSDHLDGILLINDCSPEPNVHELCRSLGEHPKIKLIENDENRGFVEVANQGIAATESDVILLNSDTLVSHGWLDRIVRTAERNPDAATVTPFTNNGTICSYPNFCTSNPLPDGVTLAELSALFSETNDGEVCELPTAVGFCMYIRRAAIDEVGCFDAEAFGRGYGEENDFCMRATAAGWKHLLAADVFVFHEGSVSFGADGAELQKRAMKVMNQRYPEYQKTIAKHVALDPARPLRDKVDEARLLIDGQSLIVLREINCRFNALNTEFNVMLEAQGKTERTLAHQLQIARTFGKEQSEQLKALEKEMSSLADYAESRAAEATEYAARIKQHEATLQNLGNNVQSMTERIEQYDLRVEQYEALLAEARKAYQDSEESKRDLISHSSSLSKDKDQLLQEREQLLQEREQLLQDNQDLRSMLSVRLQLKLMKLIGKH